MLELSDLAVAYDGVPALRGVSLSVHEGECVAIVGANGAGKSTLLRAISGLVPTAGRRAFAGRDLAALRPHEIADMGIAHVPEGRRVFPELDVVENLMVGAHRRAARTRRREALERVFALFPVLEERARQPAATLSGGEQQMLAVARGLMLWPRLLMLDEPSLGLAPIVVLRLFELLAEIRRQGTTILLVEQNVHRALRLAERGYVLESGALTMAGPSAELLHDSRVQEAYLGVSEAKHA
jgi:branched-chain amino acid transport system ATP-binding protein